MGPESRRITTEILIAKGTRKAPAGSTSPSQGEKTGWHTAGGMFGSADLDGQSEIIDQNELIFLILGFLLIEKMPISYKR
jgi:hypothetical protein